MAEPASVTPLQRPDPLPSVEMTSDEVRQVERFRRKNAAYHGEIERYFKFAIPEGATVLELGCATGRLLDALKPRYGVGIDVDAKRIMAARNTFADRDELRFIEGDVESYPIDDLIDEDAIGEGFDFIVINDLLAQLRDVQKTLARLAPLCKPSTRLVINFHNNLWRPALTTASTLGLREPERGPNWLSLVDTEALLHLAGYEPVTRAGRILLPYSVPGLGDVANRLLAKIPGLDQACLTWFVVARPLPEARPLTGPDAPSVSIVVPTLDEKGNVEGAFSRTEPMGSWTELVFVDGGSTDGTVEEIERCRQKYRSKWPRVKVMAQTGKGKGQAVHQAFAACEGDILMILDSDLTMPPEELPKYFEAITLGRGEFINGCRLVYKLEDQAMRFLNMVANHTFSKIFTYLLGQPVRDTLCGTKVLWREDYDVIWKNRAYFGEFDPFGDFDLLFGAAKLNHKILDLPIRYQAREYGEIKISRWRHGVLLLGMSGIAFRKLKLQS